VPILNFSKVSIQHPSSAAADEPLLAAAIKPAAVLEEMLLIEDRLNSIARCMERVVDQLDKYKDRGCGRNPFDGLFKAIERSGQKEEAV